MNVSILVELVIKKFHEADGYSELTQKQLEKSVTEYLSQEYKKRVDKSAAIIKKEENITGYSDIKRYEEEHENIKKEIIFVARSLAATSLEDLQDLIESS